MARLVSGFLPSVLLRRLRRTFPLRLSVLTLVTVTSKIDSTACRISALMPKCGLGRRKCFLAVRTTSRKRLAQLQRLGVFHAVAPGAFRW